MKQTEIDKLALQTADAVIAQHGRVERQGREIDKLADGPAQRIRAAELGSRLESWALRKASPRLRRSDAIAGFDQRVSELEARRQRVSEEMNTLRQRIPEAAGEHQAQLTAWHREAKGTRPESPVPALEATLRSLEEDYTALDALIDEALQEKARWVEANRNALVRDARSAVEEWRTTYLKAIEDVVQAREGLLAARRDELWAELYPDPSVRSQAPAAMLVGGVISRLRTAVTGLNITFGVPELRRLLEADVEFAASAISPDQRQVFAARDPATSAEAAAIWTETPEGQEALRRDRQKARERYAAEWGQPPAW